MNKKGSKINENLVKSFENLKLLSSSKVPSSQSFSSLRKTKYTRSTYATRSLRICYFYPVKKTFQQSFWKPNIGDFGIFRTAILRSMCTSLIMGANLPAPESISPRPRQSGRVRPEIFLRLLEAHFGSKSSERGFNLTWQVDIFGASQIWGCPCSSPGSF